MDYYIDWNYSHMAVEFQVFLIFSWYDSKHESNIYFLSLVF